MYPDPDTEINKEELDSKINFILEICSLASGGQSLIITAGSSITLSDKALHRISNDPRIGSYPKLNDEKIVPISLLPILEKNDFKNALIKLNKTIQENEINDLYIKTSGIIRNYFLLKRLFIWKIKLIDLKKLTEVSV